MPAVSKSINVEYKSITRMTLMYELQVQILFK